MRIFVISDLHVDFTANAKWLDQISEKDYKQDALIVAGDVAHNLELVQTTLGRLKTKFQEVFFVPGNHDLWIHNSDWTDSIEKFYALIDWCNKNEIHTKVQKLSGKDQHPVWVIPLFSWYSDQLDSNDSLYLEKPGEDPANRMWSDNYYIHWPNYSGEFAASAYFAHLNEELISQEYDTPLISFSHFLPRQEMMFGDSLKPDPEKARKYDRNPKFNFSRVAGSTRIENQVRHLGSCIHVYGHQHINRDRVLDGIRYIAHCLGYPEERNRGMVKGIENGLKLIWNTEKGIC